MSAYLCGPKQIAVMAKIVNEYNSYDDIETAISVLSACNFQSIVERYNYDNYDAAAHDSFGDSIPTYDAYNQECANYAQELSDKTIEKIDPRVLYGMIRNYDYQACEHDGYKTDPAHYYISSLKGVVLDRNCIDIDGWGITDEQFAELRDKFVLHESPQKPVTVPEIRDAAQIEKDKRPLSAFAKIAW